MRDRPSGAELLAEARRVLLEEMVPGLQEDDRFKALMIASAMAMARRELEAGSAPLEAEAEALCALYGVEGDTAELMRRLADDLRAGRRAGDPACYGLLRDSVRARLRESNPRAMPEA